MASHFAHGRAALEMPRKVSRVFSRISRHEGADFFDSAFYISQLKGSQLPRHPRVHYYRSGWRTGIAPHPLFDPHWYYRGQFATRNPLIDYSLHGVGNLRSPLPLFDPRWYRWQLARTSLPCDGPLFSHYLQVGWLWGLSPHPLISTSGYSSEYPESSGVEPVTHFMTEGADRGNVLSGWLDPTYVRHRYQMWGGLHHLLRFVMGRLVPERQPTHFMQSPVLDIVEGRRLLGVPAPRPSTGCDSPGEAG